MSQDNGGKSDFSAAMLEQAGPTNIYFPPESKKLWEALNMTASSGLLHSYQLRRADEGCLLESTALLPEHNLSK